MKILQLCKKFPFPLKDGESIAVTNMARAFQSLGCRMTLLAMNTTKHWFDLNRLPPDFDHYEAIHTVELDNKLHPVAALRNLFSDRSYHIERFDSPQFARELIRLLQSEDYDVVQLETLYLAPYIPVIRQYSNALIALRCHNVEHEIWERLAANSTGMKKWYLEKITPRLKKYETEQINACDVLIGITARDVDRFRALGLQRPAMVTPIGLDCNAYRPEYAGFEKPLSLSFIGSLDWMPNAEGLRWFLDRVWAPLLAPAFPTLEFHIAGRNTPSWLQGLQMPRVFVHGEVPDAAAFINGHSVMVVPLLSGSGMRAKILEGMALGKVVLSTRIGMEGIGARHQQEALLADSPEEFLNALRYCTGRRDALLQIGRNARELCSTHFDNQVVARELLDFYAQRQISVAQEV